MSSSRAKYFHTISSHILKYHKSLVIATLLSIPAAFIYNVPRRINTLNQLCQHTEEGTSPVTYFTLDENENSPIEYCLEDIFTLQNELFRLRSKRGNTEQLRDVLEKIRDRMVALESVLFHENQYERMNRHKAFTVLRNVLQCGSNYTLYIPRNESKQTKEELKEIILETQFRALCILREMVMVPRYADILINKGMLAAVFHGLYKKDTDHRTRQMASDVLFQWSKHPSTHPSFLLWNDLITEMAKKGDPLCHYTVAVMLGRIFNNRDNKEELRSYVDLIDAAWIIFKKAQDTFTSSIAHKAFLLCNDTSTIDFKERERRIQVTDYFGIMLLFTGPILGYCTIRHCTRHWSNKFLHNWSLYRNIMGASRRTTDTFYDIADRIIVTTGYGFLFGASLMYVTHFREMERNGTIDSLPFGHQRSVLLYNAVIVMFALFGAYLYYRSYVTYVLMPYCYNLMIHELYPDNKVYVSRSRKRLIDAVRPKKAESEAV